jgi:hypothetical protein
MTDPVTLIIHPLTFAAQATFATRPATPTITT